MQTSCEIRRPNSSSEWPPSYLLSDTPDHVLTDRSSPSNESFFRTPNCELPLQYRSSHEYRARHLSRSHLKSSLDTICSPFVLCNLHLRSTHCRTLSCELLSASLIGLLLLKFPHDTFLFAASFPLETWLNRLLKTSILLTLSSSTTSASRQNLSVGPPQRHRSNREGRSNHNESITWRSFEPKFLIARHTPFLVVQLHSSFGRTSKDIAIDSHLPRKFGICERIST